MSADSYGGRNFEGLDRLTRGEEWTPDEYDRFMAEHDNYWTD